MGERRVARQAAERSTTSRPSKATRAEAAIRNLKIAGPSGMRIVIVEGPDYAPSNTVMCPICGKGELEPYRY